MARQIDYLIMLLKYERQPNRAYRISSIENVLMLRATAGKFFLNNDKPVYPIWLNRQFDVKIA
jgi:hypothetical protein